MKQIAFISCSKGKMGFACEAEKLYSRSTLFKKSLAYCKKYHDSIFVLSAKHHLLEIGSIVEPYDTTLKTMTKEQKKEWAYKCFKQIKSKFNQAEHELVFYTGKIYSDLLVGLLQQEGFTCTRPLHRLMLGQRLRWFNENT